MHTDISNIRKVLILGAGTLGARIGLQFALKGFRVHFFDIDPRAFDRAQNQQQRVLSYLLRHEIIGPEQSEEAKQNMSWFDDPAAAAADVDFVSESVIEDVGIKQQVWQQFGPLCPARAILTTNTSYLLPSKLAHHSTAPERFCAFHFHDVFHANVVDIMPHPGTGPAVPKLLHQVALRLDQVPVTINKETKGYLFNKIFGNMLMTAGLMVAKGIATIEAVDRSWMGNFKMPIGPFGMMDEVGLDTVWHVTNSGTHPEKKIFIKFIQAYIDEGRLGVKSGEGFYQYPHPAFKGDTFLMQ